MKRCLFALVLCVLPALTLSAGEPGPLAAPGLRVPSAAMPYALDVMQDQPELVPIHRSYVNRNNHAGTNAAGELAGSFLYKPKATTELTGAAAVVTLHTRRPKLYFRVDNDAPNADPDNNTLGWSIMTAKVQKDKRVLATMRFTQLTGHAKRHEGVVEATEDHLPDGWTVLTPKEDLPDGQYVLAPVLKNADTYAATVYGFGINPAAPANDGAVKASGEAR